MIIDGYEVEKRKPWFSNEDYTMSYEKINHELFIHVTIESFSKDVLEDIKQKWNDFKLKAYSLGYENIFSYTKDMRIVELVGGAEVIGDWEGKKVVRWVLN